MLIDTERLRLRRFQPADIPAFAAYRSDPEVARYQEWDFPLSLESAGRLVRRYARSDPARPGWFPYAVELKADGCLLGDVAVHRQPGGEAEVGFSLARERQGHGYATEAVRGVLADLFGGGLRTVWAECDVRNQRSARLLERIGFEFVSQRTVFVRGKREWTELRMFSLPAEKWNGPGEG
ncbi:MULTISPECIES: GNAT family N-acetyltransferase [Streptomyces]|uniref:GNAT family N-acetyltransferase n=1 Tax=Streptomyces ortus TaxID=2867268 RepID=A0ABT3UUQ1_9ACTN|nr:MULTISPECIES: GNAT family N-acetyltransferase [Streptomyces]MCX4231287.1 GNAT family N-acetyltransferase [Streptomyces ortus]